MSLHIVYLFNELDLGVSCFGDYSMKHMNNCIHCNCNYSQKPYARSKGCATEMESSR